MSIFYLLLLRVYQRYISIVDRLGRCLACLTWKASRNSSLMCIFFVMLLKGVLVDVLVYVHLFM